MTGSPQALPPWSPLNDPQLAAQIQGSLQLPTERLRRRAQFWTELLSQYAWQEYPVKCGAWVLEEAGVTGGSNLSGPWTKRVWASSFSWMQLYDPATRQPIAVHRVDPDLGNGKGVALPFDQRTTSVWFAGNPLTCGLFSPAGDGHHAFFGERAGQVVHIFNAWLKGPEYYAQWSAKVAAHRDSVPDGVHSIWMADHPQRPANPRRFSQPTLG